jgi:hypothetical protein
MTKTEKKFYDMDTCRKVSHSVMMFDSSWGSLVAGDGRDGGGGGDEVNLELVR